MGVTRSLLLIAIAVPAIAQTFDVASVKPLKPSEGKEPPREIVSIVPDAVSLRNVSLRSALMQAYGLKDFQISGPGWISTDLFEIVAKASGPAPPDQLRHMLQTLLAERFKMTTHTETKELPVYALTVAKGGIKAPSSTGPAAPQKFVGGTAILNGYTIPELADAVSKRIFGLERPVVDQTGAPGAFDFSLKLADSIQEMKMAAERAQREPDPSPAVNALLAMGIKVEAKKAPTQMLVVDHAEKVPTEN